MFGWFNLRSRSNSRACAASTDSFRQFVGALAFNDPGDRELFERAPTEFATRQKRRRNPVAKEADLSDGPGMWGAGLTAAKMARSRQRRTVKIGDLHNIAIAPAQAPVGGPV